jgi:hypothetical protein
MFSFKEKYMIVTVTYECHSLFLLTLRGQVERRSGGSHSATHRFTSTVVCGKPLAIKKFL